MSEELICPICESKIICYKGEMNDAWIFKCPERSKDKCAFSFIEVICNSKSEAILAFKKITRARGINWVSVKELLPEMKHENSTGQLVLSDRIAVYDKTSDKLVIGQFYNDGNETSWPFDIQPTHWGEINLPE